MTKGKTYKSSKIKRHLEQYKIATLEDLKKALGCDVRMTIYRKLKELNFRTSYSHRGKYYTLKKTPQFNEAGIWSSKSVWFSSYGTLLETTKELVIKSDMGYSAVELEEVLHVSVKESLMTLFKKGCLFREQFSGVYIYFAISTGIQKGQAINRKKHRKSTNTLLVRGEDGLSQHDLNTVIILFFSFLNEKQKRIYSGLESMRIGYGGDQIIANLLSLNCHTVAKGRKEIMEDGIEVERIRKNGGGRISIKKKQE